MTNAEKYLKDGVDQFAYELSNYMFDTLGWYEGDVYNLKKTIENFLKSNIKPTLTEDERVILRNLPKEYKFIHRVRNKRWLELSSDENDKGHLAPFAYDHLFQFIKERRRILY